MVSICFYFQVHQPYRLRNYNVFEIGKNHSYTNRQKNLDILKKVAEKCYLPTNKLMLDLLNKHEEFKISYSFSGVILEQLEEFMPNILQSFKDLVDTGKVEILDETYYHSLAFLHSKPEFREQVILHNKKIRSLFRQKPTIFRNTELVYNNELANFIESMGYKGILAEGADHILGWRSPNFIYRPKTASRIKLLLKNYKLSDDVAFRFSDRSWKEWPLTVDKYAKWINAVNGNGNIVNLFMDYETFGEHQWADTGIFGFLRNLPGELLKHPDNDFKTPSEAIRKYNPVSELDIHSPVSWVASSPSLGRIDYGPTQTYGETAYDNSSRMNGAVTVTITGLAKETTYYYMITAVNNGGENTVTGTFRTAKEGFGQPYSAYGQILCMDGSPASSTMVYVTVEHQGVESQLLSDMTSSEGYWFVDLANLKDKNGAVYQWYNGDNMKIEAQGGTLGYGCKEGTIGLHSYYSQIFIGIPGYLRPLASLSASSTVVKIGNGAAFDASNSDGNITGYFFDFGDGTNSGWRTEPVVAHVFLTSGTYNVSLKVRDNDIESNNVANVIITVTTDQSSEPENFIPFLEIEIVILCIFSSAMLLKYKRKRR